MKTGSEAIIPETASDPVFPKLPLTPFSTHIRTAADVPADRLVQLGLLYGPIVAAFGVVSEWCYTHYNLTRERHAEILIELERRHTQVDLPQARAG